MISISNLLPSTATLLPFNATPSRTPDIYLPSKHISETKRELIFPSSFPSASFPVNPMKQSLSSFFFPRYARMAPAREFPVTNGFPSASLSTSLSVHSLSPEDTLSGEVTWTCTYRTSRLITLQFSAISFSSLLNFSTIIFQLLHKIF